MSFADGLVLADSALALGGLTKEELTYRIDGFRKSSRGGRHAMAIELGFHTPLVHVAIPCAGGRTIDAALAWRNVDDSWAAVSSDDTIGAPSWACEDIDCGEGLPPVHRGWFSAECLENQGAFECMLEALGVGRLPGGSEAGKEKAYTPRRYRRTVRALSHRR